jgi:hypothetical protein
VRERREEGKARPSPQAASRGTCTRQRGTAARRRQRSWQQRQHASSVASPAAEVEHRCEAPLLSLLHDCSVTASLERKERRRSRPSQTLREARVPSSRQVAKGRGCTLAPAAAAVSVTAGRQLEPADPVASDCQHDALHRVAVAESQPPLTRSLTTAGETMTYCSWRSQRQWMEQRQPSSASSPVDVSLSRR